MIKNKKILVLATGWHFSSHFYEMLPKQFVPKNWEVDYFCVAHRLPEDKNTIEEKEQIRNKSCDNFLEELDKKMYEYPISTKQIEDFGWKFMLEENTIGDMEVFNQWSEKYDYKQYDIIVITHDDNYILSDKLFLDVVENNINVYKPVKSSRYGISNHQFKVEEVPINDGWLFIENGYSEYIPKAFEPRGSFSFYKKEFIDMLPNNKFDMSDRGKEVLTREGRTDSIGYEGILSWNSPVGTLRDWLYEKDLVEDVRWFSKTKRISDYCIEGERGLLGGHKAGENYLQNMIQKMKDLNWLENDKYSVFTILNSVYMKFGKIWLNSMHDNVDMNKIENIFIGDTGLNDNDKKYLEKFNKVKIINTDVSDTDSDFKMWDSKWHNSVSQKTKLFRELVKTQDLPIIMLDADLLFLKDISCLINSDYDIQVCFRNHERREKPHPMDYLASYVCVNNKKSLKFLDAWVDMIENSDSVEINGNLITAKETPCLCKTVEVFKQQHNDIKIGDVAEDIVSVYDPPGLPTMIEPDVCRIIHFKGGGAHTFSNNIDEAYYGKVVDKGWGDYVDEKGYLT